MLRALRKTVRRALELRDAWRWAGDLRTFRQVVRPSAGVQQLRVRFAEKTMQLHVRGGTHDLALARTVLREESEYRVPIDLHPRVIFDIGANIGITTLYFAALYPAARICCFEPLPANVELLRLNTAPLGDRVTIIPKGLGEKPGVLRYGMGDDPTHFGGGGFRHVTDQTPGCVELPVTTPAQVCRELGIEHVDLIKIDTEGGEWPILRAMPPHLLAGASVVIGELHGWEDERVIELLSATHELGIVKRWDQGCYPFIAVRKAQTAPSALRLAA